MNPLAVAALLGALGFAGADWLAIAHDNRRVEYVCKPATMVLLVACALALNPASPVERTWFFVAFVFCLAGDVFLMLPADRFLVGLASFLFAHVAFAAGFIASGFSAARGALAMTALIIVGAVLVQRVVRGAKRSGQAALAPALVVYGVALSLTVGTAFASRQPLAVIPALLFYASDTLIAFRRFVGPQPWMPVAIIVTYHLAQVGFVLLLAL